jgi:hypothetical protein
MPVDFTVPMGFPSTGKPSTECLEPITYWLGFPSLGTPFSFLRSKTTLPQVMTTGQGRVQAELLHSLQVQAKFKV